MCETTAWSPSVRHHSDRRATFSAMGTPEGSISNALDHTTSPWGGSGASSTAPAARPAGDPRHLHGTGDETGCLLGAHVDGGGVPDGSVDDHAQAHAEFGVVRRGLGVRVVEADHLAPDALDPELGRLAAPGCAERGVRQRRELVGGEGHQVEGVGRRTGRPAAV